MHTTTVKKKKVSVTLVILEYSLGARSQFSKERGMRNS